MIAQGPATHPSPAREGPPLLLISGSAPTRLGKLHSANLNCARGTNLSPSASLLWKATLAYFSPRLLLLGPYCMAGGLLGHKPTKIVSSCGEKADVAGKGLVCKGPSNPPLASSGGTPYWRSQQRHKTRLGKLNSANLKCPQGTNLSPNAFLLRKTTLA